MFDDFSQVGRVSGFMLGTVLANNDSEKKGTLKVRLGSEGASKNILERVKVLTPFAGDAYGVYMLPEVGEQVVVGFFGGCFDRPFVLGSLHTISDAMLGESFHEANALKRFKTKGGTLVEFNDADGEEVITVKTPENLSVVLREKPQTITISAAATLIELDGKNGKLTLQGEKELCLKTGSAELSMKSGGDILLKGTGLTLKGTSEVKAESGGTLELKGQKTEVSGAMVEVKASGMMTIKGAMTKIN